MTLNLYSWEPSLIEQALASPLSSRRHGHAAPVLEPALLEAYQACESVTRSHSRSFYVASHFLPEEKRRAVRALYAFCRRTDDIVDLHPGTAAAQLAAWRTLLSQNSFSEEHGVLTAWLDARIRYHIPARHIEQFLEGVARDLSPTSYPDFDALAQYCYGVASTVGLMSMAIIGFSGENAIPYAIRLGIALQMTNILRDVAEDWQRGRLYLPLDELDAFGLSRASLAESVRTGAFGDNWRAFMRFQIDRTRRLYAEAWPGIGLLHPEGRLAIAAAADLYAGILDDIEAHGYDVFTRRAHVPDWKKLAAMPGIIRRVRSLPPFEQ